MALSRGFTAWHGSPHCFAEFDLSKIGTRCGYIPVPYGVYLADSPAVASFVKGLGTDKATDAGFLYEVEVGVSADDLMVWDAPLWAQPSNVLERLQLLSSLFSLELPLGSTGADLYINLTVKLASKQDELQSSRRLASSWLVKSGIPGVRLREKSPWSGEPPTLVFVMFAVERCRIASRNGEPLPHLDPAPVH